MRYCPACRAEYAPRTERCHDCEVDLVDRLEEIPSEPRNLVTIAAFGTPLEASLLASRLDAEGIDSFIADAETVAMHGLLTGAIGGVKVQVVAADVPRAAAIARRQAATSASPPCPRCGARNARRRGLSLPVAILAVLTLGLLALLMPVVWKCADCGNEW